MSMRVIAGLLIAFTLSGCGAGVGLTTNSATNAPTGVKTQSTALSLQGTPPASIVSGSVYSFQPTVSTSSGVAFSVKGQPAWMTFNATTGALSGTPGTGDVGMAGPITIAATDGSSTATIGPFTVQVSAASGGTPAPQAPTIAGTPIVSVIAGSSYSFTPTVTNPSGATLTFTVQNLPAWAAFNNTTGALTGTPTAADVGVFGNIVIGVSAGAASVTLPAFSIAVTQNANGSATLSWTPPTQNTDGSPLQNLAGYWIYYGTSATSLNQSVQVANPGIATYVVENLSPGTWYFSVVAYTTANTQSADSVLASKTIN